MSLKMLKYINYIPNNLLSATEKNVLKNLAFYANDKGASIFPSYKRIAEDTGYSKRWVICTIRSLIKKGILVLKRAGSRMLQLANEYAICFTKLFEWIQHKLPKAEDPFLTIPETGGKPLELEVANSCTTPQIPPVDIQLYEVADEPESMPHTDLSTPDLFTASEVSSPQRVFKKIKYKYKKNTSPYNPPYKKDYKPNTCAKDGKEAEVIHTTDSAVTKKARKQLRDFEEFFDAFPNKLNKVKAFRAYKRARRLLSAKELLDASKTYYQLMDLTERLQYATQAHTWLRNKRWEDDLEAELQRQSKYHSGIRCKIRDFINYTLKGLPKPVYDFCKDLM